MSDIFSSEKRSEIMSKIAGKETKLEIKVRKYLFSKGFRFRKNDKRYPGKPDIVLPKYKIIIFINGCFWHGHHCPKGKLPETNINFWKNKIKGNVERDNKNIQALAILNWKVLIIWECMLKKDFVGNMENLVGSIIFK